MRPISAVPMLELNNVHAGYSGSKVLEGLTLSLAQGEIVAFLGRNGMGKTTTLLTIMGQIKIDSGTIRFDGKSITGRDTYEIARSGIAYVPQGREIFGSLSVAENLRLGARRGGDVDLAYALFPALRNKQNEPGSSLSGGQQQQLAIARALVTRPKLLLLDEPSEGIQPSIVTEIAAIVMSAARASGISVLLVEQNTDLALAAADRALFIENGVITGTYAANQVSKPVLQQHMGI